MGYNSFGDGSGMSGARVRLAAVGGGAVWVVVDAITAVVTAGGGNAIVHTTGTSHAVSESADQVWRAVDAATGHNDVTPARCFTDDLGRRWEWCGGEPGTWGWRVTRDADDG